MTFRWNGTIQMISNGSAINYTLDELTRVLNDRLNNQTISPMDSYVTIDMIDVLWQTFTAIQILLIPMGYSILASSIIPSPIETKCLGAFAFTILLSFALTFALSFGGNGNVIGNNGFFLLEIPLNDPRWAFWILQTSIQLVVTTLVYIPLERRVLQCPLLVYLFIIHLLIYPVIVHSIWSTSGLVSYANTNATKLFHASVLDLGGSSAVHITSGIAVLIPCILTRNSLEPKSTPPSPHQMPFRYALGTLLILFGSFGLIQASTLTLEGNCSSLVVRSSVNLLLSGVSSSIIAGSMSIYFIDTKYPFSHGLLSGLVGISATGSTTSPGIAILIGIISGLLFVASSNTVRVYQLNDDFDIISIHVGNGFWGLLASGIFSQSIYIKEAIECNQAHVYHVNPMVEKSCGLAEGCSNHIGLEQFGANLIFGIIIMIYTAIISISCCLPFYFNGYFNGNNCNLNGFDDMDEFYPTDDDGSPWNYYYGLHQGDDDAVSPRYNISRDRIQSSIEKRYRFSPESISSIEYQSK